MKEVSFFENNNVIVTQSRFIVASKIYEIQNITSVKVEVIRSKMAYKIILMVVGFLFIFFKDLRIIGVVIFFLSLFSLYFTEERFAVHLFTKNGEIDGLVSIDKEYIEQVVKAINYALEKHYVKIGFL